MPERPWNLSANPLQKAFIGCFWGNLRFWLAVKGAYPAFALYEWFGPYLPTAQGHPSQGRFVRALLAVRSQAKPG